ncbi:MAG: hypothetical protein Kow009_08930 [Spirochaetales bacterium]
METERKTLITVSLSRPLDPSVEKELREALEKVPGIASIEKVRNDWILGCFEGAVSRGVIEEIFLHYGAKLVQADRKRGNFLTRWLESLAESNRKRFGSETPDCCTLNSKQNIQEVSR